MNSPRVPSDEPLPDSGEDALIQRWFAPIAGPAGLGLTDDTALVTPPPGHDLVLTADAVVAGVHFFADDPPDAIARKALRVNLSDIAAKGARPLGFLLTLCLPDHDEARLAGLAEGLGTDAHAFDCPLIGGDTVRTSGPFTLAITMFGALPSGSMVRRDGARPGDILFVSGTVGDAALGLLARMEPRRFAALAPVHRAHLMDRYLLPQPRCALADALRRDATSAMDVSDGLAGDLAKLCRVSGVGAVVELSAMPFSDAVASALRLDPELRIIALTGGDDYEVLGTCPPARWPDLSDAARRSGISLTHIGVCAERVAGIAFREADASIAYIPLRGYSHPG